MKLNIESRDTHFALTSRNCLDGCHQPSIFVAVDRPVMPLNSRTGRKLTTHNSWFIRPRSKAYELIRGALSSYFSEEKARGKYLYSDNTGHAFATRPSRSGAPSTVPVCNHCKKLKRKSINHKEEDCYMLHPEKEMEFLKKKSEALRKKLEDLNKKSEGSEGSALSVLGTKSPANAKLVPYFYRQVEL